MEQSQKGGSDGAQSDSLDEEEFTLKSGYLQIQDQVAYDSEVIPTSKSASKNSCRIVSNCGPGGQDQFLGGAIIKNIKMLN